MRKEVISKSQATIFKIFPSPPPSPRRGEGKGEGPHSEIRIDLPLFSLIGKGFVDQHHGDIIFNGVEQVTGFAD
jgi:hypothetical protein